MTDAMRVSSPITGTDKTLTFETGKLAQLADGAVTARIGDTVMLATVAAIVVPYLYSELRAKK